MLFARLQQSSNKASGADEISHTLLKCVAIFISIPFELLFNKSLGLTLGLTVFPNKWKLAHVKPLFRKAAKPLDKLQTYFIN